MSPWRLVTLSALALVLAACQSTPQRVEPSPPSEAMDIDDTYSNDRFRDLVARYADEAGQVDYGDWQASESDMALLDQQVALIARVSPDSHPEQFPRRAQARSYWINTYNTLVLDAVLALVQLRAKTAGLYPTS